ncbi:ribosomal protein S5 domain 2-type protein [Chytriomyces cf. hyalinus JEL632]|nr:ribosomal protein S5 domain 2-type protein [Chytriomyces cf. hyalinus JEL632]
MNTSATTVVSAPGKVLICGGYLVLDSAYSGLVVGTDSRFYSAVTSKRSGKEGRRVVVNSPQFNGGRWEYILDKEGRLVQIPGADNQIDRNKYVQYALQLTLSVAAKLDQDFDAHFGELLEIVIVGHNDFYSQRPQLDSKNLPVTTASLKSLPPFCPTLTTIANVHKTGLGSSAAMITSLVASLLVHFKAISIDNTTSSNEKDIQFTHNMAQFVHCLAQGKVGSGFDVSSAIFGSHLYRRFDPELISGLMAHCESVGIEHVTANEILEVVRDKKWDSRVQPVHLPPGVRLMLADVDAGSSTPKLVSGVLGWRKANPIEAHTLWKQLDKENMAVADTLMKISQVAHENEAAYQSALAACSTSVSSAWSTSDSEIVKLFGKVNACFSNVRSLLRKMSHLANVPIEPESQTRLLDTISQLPGVVMSGVPGAGGFDAIFTLVIENPAESKEGKNAAAVEHIWKHWTESNVGPLLAGASNGGVECVKLENVDGLSRFF